MASIKKFTEIKEENVCFDINQVLPIIIRVVNDNADCLSKLINVLKDKNIITEEELTIYENKKQENA